MNGSSEERSLRARRDFLKGLTVGMAATAASVAAATSAKAADSVNPGWAAGDPSFVGRR